MDNIKTMLESLWDSLFVVLPSDIGVFLVSILSVVLGVALLRIVLGG